MAMGNPTKPSYFFTYSGRWIHILSGGNPPISHRVNLPLIPSSCLPMRWMSVMLLSWVIRPYG